MKILAFMQNQWFRNPENVRRLLARETDPVRAEKLRRRLIAYALFAGCKSGRVLRQHFGGLCDKIIWEESSREIGSSASSWFPADHAHMLASVRSTNPDVIITFGQVAADGLKAILDHVAVPASDIIWAPHPAARHATAPAELRTAAKILRMKLETIPA